MTTQEKDEILVKIKEVENFDFESEIINNNPQKSINDIIIRSFPAIKLILMAKKAIRQLEEELQTDNYFFLPLSLTNDAYFGSDFNLLINVGNLKKHIQENNLESFGASLRNQILYQKFWGFWEKSERKIHSFNEEKLVQQQLEVDILIKSIESRISETNKLNEKLTDIITQKSQELQIISDQLNYSNSNITEIKQNWEQAIRLKNEIESLQNQANENVELIRTQFRNQDEDFSKLYQNLEKKEGEIEKKLKEANLLSKEILDSKTEIKDRTDEAKRLLGLSADAALGGRFSQREIKISKSLLWWRVAIGGSVLVAVGWTVIVFLCLATKTSLPYLDFLVNLLKTSPGFVLMGYIMTQYNKERTIEEEYAFRAAIAETISAYADMLENQDDADNSNDSRQKMLLDAIRQVYSKPEMQKEKISTRFYQSQTKELIEVLKQIKMGQ